MQSTTVRTTEELLFANTCSFRPKPGTIVTTEEAKLLLSSGAKKLCHGLESCGDGETMRATERYELNGHPFLWLDNILKPEKYPSSDMSVA